MIARMLHGALIGAEWWVGLSALLCGSWVIACCIGQARANAKVRAARRESSAEALELAKMRRDFAAIVSVEWGADA